ncbi:TetR/AcrR family transcriptional regulator [Mycolicibacterium komossense]|uniref:TetR/AcrR family transcriptional regulator C-terminal domain-containing protein n=1 Tax=Mycolicibacterium komossense TaxID=1779 RepID=A0ABT3CAV1_9MYCO|nr:TetR/AcrR family transcriptional regulator C-terminal domain-containing protein [Mycolicibacterium komossense]MCV7226600.1 TetR/AcrR family transcriptional regulator C-terminal domain-containing protein [Mycolicibacterium komossense]
MTRTLIVDVARTHLDNAGIENFSMRALAAAIGVTPMAIYRHVGDREQLLGLVLDDVSAPFPDIELPADPRERIATLLQAVFEVLVSQRWIAEVLRTGSPGGAGALWLVDQIIAAATETGLSHTEALVMYRALWSYTLGSVLTVETNKPAAAATTQQKLDTLGSEEFPHLVAALKATDMLDRHSAYHRGIDYLIRGFCSQQTHDVRDGIANRDAEDAGASSAVG